MTDLASLVIKIQALGAAEAKQAMDALTAAGAKTEASTISLTVAQKALTDAQAVGAPITAKMIQDVGGWSNAQKVLNDALKAAPAATTAASEAAKVLGSAHGDVANKVGLSSLQIREFLVLAREAARGDMTRLAGSASILAGSFGLMTSEALLAAAGIIALAAPFAVLAFATIKGEVEIDKFNASLIATGNYAGLTQDSLESMGKSIAAASHTTESASRTTIEALAASGKIGADAIGSLADAAQNYSKITGENASKFVKEYEGMGDNLVQFAVKHESVYHDLTVAQVEQIDLLVKEGKERQAQATLAADIDAVSKQRADEHLVQQKAQEAHYGTLITLMHGVADAAKSMWDQILNIGRPATPSDEIAKAQQRVDGLNSQYNTHEGNSPAVQAARQAAEDNLLTLQRRANAQSANAAADAKTASDNHNAIQAKYGDGKPHGGKRPEDQSQQVIDQSVKDEIAARAALTQNIEQLAALKVDEVRADLTAKEDRLKKDLAEKKITASAASTAASYDEIAANEKAALIIRQRDFAIENATLAQRQAVLSYTEAAAKIEAQLAPTVAMRAAIEDKALADRQKFETDQLETQNRQAVTNGTRTQEEANQLAIAQAVTQLDQLVAEARQHQVDAIHEAASVEQSGLEKTKTIAEAQASLLRSTYARAVAEADILKTTQAIEVSKAQEAVDAAQAAGNQAAITAAENDLTALRAKQAADRKLLERETRLIDAVSSAASAGSDFASALKNHDFGKALDDLQSAIETVKTAFEQQGVSGGIYAAGSAIGNAVGGKAGKTISDASSAGATALTLTGNPIIAAAAAAVVAIFDLAQSKPSNNGAIATISGNSFALSGDKRNADTTTLANTAASTILQGEQILANAGITLTTLVSKVDIGTRDPAHVYLSDGQVVTAGVADAAGAAEAGLKAMLQGATYANDAEKKLVDSMLAAGDGFDQISAGLADFAAAQQLGAGLAGQIQQLQDPQGYDVAQVKQAIQAQKDAAQAAADAGYLTADQLAGINDQLATLQGLQIDQVMAKYATATTDALKTANDNLTAANSNVDTQRTALTDAYNAQVAAIQSTIDGYQKAADSLNAFRDSLTSGSDALLSPTRQYAVTRAQLQALTALAPGDPAREGGLQVASEAFLAASKAASPTAAAYARDLAYVRSATDASAKAAEAQVSDGQKQIDLLNAQVSGLIDIKTAVVDGATAVATAIANLNFATASAAGAQNVVDTLTPPSAAANSNTASGFDAGSYLAKNPDVAAAYATYQADQATWATGGFSLGDTIDQFATEHYNLAGKAEGRSFATGGSMTLSGPSSGDKVPFTAWGNGGETVTISRQDNMARVAAALEQQNQHLARQNDLLTAMGKDTKLTAKVLKRVTRDGEALLTTAAA